MSENIRLSTTCAGARPAPGLAELLNDPEQLAERQSLVFARRDADIVAVSEAEAIGNLGRAVKEVQAIYAEHGDDLFDAPYVDVAQRFSNELQLIGNKEFSNGAAAIAGRLLERLTIGPGDTLYVATERFGSQTLVLAEVLSQLALLDQDAVDFIQPFELSRSEPLRPDAAKAIKSQGGVVLLDDWVISGKQMDQAVSALTASGDLNKEDIEVNAICARESHFSQPKARTQVHAAYAFPSRNGAAERPDVIGITGAHSATDYGFGLPLLFMYSGLPTEHAHWVSEPLLNNVVKAYRPPRLPEVFAGTDEERAELIRRQNVCAQMAAQVIDASELAA